MPFIKASWESLRSFSVVLPVKSRQLSGLPARLDAAQSLRAELISICRQEYFPDPYYEALLQRVAGGDKPTGEDARYLQGCAHSFNELACEKIHIAVVCEEPRESLSPQLLTQLQQLTDRIEDCRVIAFEQEMLLINGGWKNLITAGRWTRGQLIHFLVENEKLPSDRRAFLRQVMDPHAR